ncbi:pseudouridine-5'-phosphate glycosidase [Halanaerobium sp.]|nr:pseudouridylate synthase [Geotoga sp.]PUU87160.1 MAG: IndA [Halanaerobium sp.]
MMKIKFDFLDIKPEVKEAIDEGKPIISLESTIISHGMPYPQNVETAKMLENLAREKNVVPATIAVIGGKIKIGLNEDDLEFIAKTKNIVKASRRDISYVISQKLNAATTVSATMIFSAMAGIKIFATGGIGGVHRGAEKNFDISADLQELSRTNVAVVCAGAKAILDLKLTMEYLETMGVPVIGYRTDQLPAFYSKDSGLKVPFRLDSVADIAGLMKTKWDLGLSGGVLITNPIPEEFSMDSSYINKSIDKALIKAKELNIEGKQLTPFLLEEIKNITEGKSLDSNIELVKNNVLLACEISKQYYS